MIEELMREQPRQDTQRPEMKTIQGEIENKLRNLIADTFNTAPGEALLDLWDDIYVRQATWRPGFEEGRAQYRAGENNFILTIRAILNQRKMAGQV